VRRVIGYFVGALAASLIYIGWLLIGMTRLHGAAAEFGFNLGFSLLLWMTDGFGLTLVFVAVPWILAVWVCRILRWPGGVYFPLVGAISIFVIGCIMASVSPKPLWIEDQTFLQGAAIAAARQGLSFLVSGFVFGFAYWLISERRIPTR